MEIVQNVLFLDIGGGIPARSAVLSPVFLNALGPDVYNVKSRNREKGIS